MSMQVMSVVIPPLVEHNQSVAAVAFSVHQALLAQDQGQGQWELVVCACEAAGVAALSAALAAAGARTRAAAGGGQVRAVEVDCSNVGKAMNAALRATSGALVAFASGCLRLPPGWLAGSVRWFCADGACGTRGAGEAHEDAGGGEAEGGRGGDGGVERRSGPRLALLSYPEEGVVSPQVERVIRGG